MGEDLYDFGRLARRGVGRAGGALLDDAVLAGIAAALAVDSTNLKRRARYTESPARPECIGGLLVRQICAVQLGADSFTLGLHNECGTRVRRRNSSTLSPRVVLSSSPG